MNKHLTKKIKKLSLKQQTAVFSVLGGLCIFSAIACGSLLMVCVIAQWWLGIAGMAVALVVVGVTGLDYMDASVHASLARRFPDTNWEEL